MKRFVLKSIKGPIAISADYEREYMRGGYALTADVWPDPPTPDAPKNKDGDILPYMAFYVTASRLEVRDSDKGDLLDIKLRMLRLSVEVAAEGYGYEFVDETAGEA